MTVPTMSEVERRTLAILEQLADDPGNDALMEHLLADEDPAVTARVRSIARTTADVDAMPTDLPDIGSKMPHAPPERFGPFRFISPLGEGGMGEVWRGERDDGLFEQVVAIKLIQPHLQVRAGDAFDSERRILARFEHPGIARLIDGGTTNDGRACLVMEYVDGVPFDASHENAPLSARVELFRQILSAVAYAHSRLVAHGDLKPSNILVDTQGRVRLLDFGIARLITDDANAFLMSGAITSSFASPARLAGEPPSIADDLFALGRLLQIAVGDAEESDLAAIALKASAANASERYTSVPELLADLERWSRHKPVSAVPRTALYVARKFAWRNWRGILAACLLAAALGYAGASLEQAQRDRSEASARFQDTRAASRYLLFTLYDELAGYPNTLKLRQQVAATAQQFLNRLAQSSSTVSEVKLEAAQGLLRLADVQGSPGMASLGEGASARRNIDTAIRLLTAQSGPVAQKLRFEALLDSAFLAQNGESDENRAERDLTAARKILTASTGLTANQKGRFFLAQSSVDRWAARNELSLDESDQAIAILGGDTSFDTLKLRSKVFERKADALFYLDRHAEAITAYRAAVVPLEQATALYPNDIEAHRRLAHIQWNLATALMDYGDPKEALSLLENAEAQIRIAIAFDPHDDDARHRLDMFEQSRGETLVILGRLDEGFQVMATMADSYRRTWQAKPADARALRNYAVTLGGLADQQGKHARLQQACTNWREYLRLYGLIAASGHLKEDDRANGIAPAAANVAKYCH